MLRVQNCVCGALYHIDKAKITFYGLGLHFLTKADELLTGSSSPRVNKKVCTVNDDDADILW